MEFFYPNKSMKNWTPQDEALLELLQEKKQRAEALEFRKSVARKLRTIADGIDSGEIDFHISESEKQRKNLVGYVPSTMTQDT